MKIARIFGIIFFLALLGGGFYIYQEASNLQEPEFIQLENIKFKNVTLPPNITLTFTSDAVLNNPNAHQLTISKVDFDVIVDGKKTSHFTQDLEVLMPANSQFKLPLSFEVPLEKRGIIDTFKSAWKKKGIKIRSKGDITIRAGRVKFDIPFDYDDEYRIEDYL